MTIIADIADACGLTQKQVRAEVGEAIAADAVLAIILENFWPHVSADEIARVAGVSKEMIQTSLLRESERRRREVLAKQRARADQAQSTVDRRPRGTAPDAEHLWCKRGLHWVIKTDMGRNSHSTSGYGDWCRACWREYWALRKGKPAKASPEKASPPTKASPGKRRSARTGTTRRD